MTSLLIMYNDLHNNNAYCKISMLNRCQWHISELQLDLIDFGGVWHYALCELIHFHLHLHFYLKEPSTEMPNSWDLCGNSCLRCYTIQLFWKACLAILKLKLQFWLKTYFWAEKPWLCQNKNGAKKLWLRFSK